ncbi:Tht1-like nuclear fusion protein-domain-containing protein [Limtongia smithiae]|uniref:Tht1-like nuclear fusion protein-domain-containing protein n=1 Tax=Limtongia smithiae TaxID=1125753 RepID=UPI0034CFC208
MSHESTRTSAYIKWQHRLNHKITTTTNMNSLRTVVSAVAAASATIVLVTSVGPTPASAFSGFAFGRSSSPLPSSTDNQIKPNNGQIRLSHSEIYDLDPLSLSLVDSYSSCLASFDYADGKTSTVRTVYAQLCDLAPPPSCFRDVLQDILPTCEIMTTQERVSHAVLLTICELSAANIAPPRACLFDIHTKQAWEVDTKGRRKSCLRDLSDSPQLWTSFSGNFRSVATLCHAERRNHEKEEVIRLHQNLTAVQAHALHLFRDHLATAEGASTETLSEIAVTWRRTLQHVEDSIIGFDARIEAMSSRSAETLNIQLEEMLLVLERTITRVMTADDIAVALQGHIDESYRTFELLSSKYAGTLDDHYSSSLAFASAMHSHLHVLMQNYTAAIATSLENLTTAIDSLARESTDITNTHEGLAAYIARSHDSLATLSQEHISALQNLHDANSIALSLSAALSDLQYTANDAIFSVEATSIAASARVSESLNRAERKVDDLVASLDSAETRVFGLTSRIRFASRAMMAAVALLLAMTNGTAMRLSVSVLAVIYAAWPIATSISRLAYFLGRSLSNSAIFTAPVPFLRSQQLPSPPASAAAVGLSATSFLYTAPLTILAFMACIFFMSRAMGNRRRQKRQASRADDMLYSFDIL